jgi:hypothetical protein
MLGADRDEQPERRDDGGVADLGPEYWDRRRPVRKPGLQVGQADGTFWFVDSLFDPVEHTSVAGPSAADRVERERPVGRGPGLDVLNAAVVVEDCSLVIWGDGANRPPRYSDAFALRI